MAGITYVRLCPQLASDIRLDETSDEVFRCFLFNLTRFFLIICVKLTPPLTTTLVIFKGFGRDAVEKSSLYARTKGSSQLTCQALGEDHQLICVAQQFLHYNTSYQIFDRIKSPEAIATEHITFKHVCHLITSFCASKALSIPEPNKVTTR